jgi:conjugative transfer region protein TrbK
MRSIGTGRAIGLVTVGAAIVTTAVHFDQRNSSQADRPGAVSAAHVDPLTRELRRCQSIGMAAQDDAACEAAWAENRRRFFDPLSDRGVGNAALGVSARSPR